MVSVRDLMVFLDHAKFSAPLCMPEQRLADVEAREFKQLPRLKKGQVNYNLLSVPSHLSFTGLQGLGFPRGQETGSITLKNILEREKERKINLTFRSSFTSFRGELASLPCSSLT